MAKEARVGTNLFAKSMRIISNKYREGHERMFGKKEIGCKKCDKITCICNKESTPHG